MLEKLDAKEAAFLEAICATPEDDEIRLVFSDWLDDHGQEARAEFIRAQIQLAANATDSPRRRQLAHRARELLDAHEAEWSGLVPGLVLEWRFVRGFVESLLVHQDDLRWLATEAVFDRVPVRTLGVLSLGRIDLLRQLPEGTSLRSLDLVGNPFGRAEVEYLATLPALAHLQELNLAFTLLDDAACEELLLRPWFHRLTRLGLGGNPISTPMRRRLEASLGQTLDFSCDRDPDHVYRIQDPNDWVWFATGTIMGHQQVFVHEAEDETQIAHFDFEGNLLQVVRRRTSVDIYSERRQELTEKWLEKRGFVAGTIRVKRFRLDGSHELVDHPDWAPGNDEPDDPEWGNVIDVVRNWLASGNFVWKYAGDDFWLDGNGEVTGT